VRAALRPRNLVASLVLAAAGCGAPPPAGKPASAPDAGAPVSPGKDGGSGPAPEMQPPAPEQGPPEQVRNAPDGACGLAISDIAIYQGVKSVLVRSGVEVRPRPADVVQRRQALVRVFLKANSSFTPASVAASLTLTGRAGKKVLLDQRMISGSSADGQLDSTLNFDVPADYLGDSTSYAIELTAPSACAAVRFPAEKAASMTARRVGALKIKLVPIRFAADGSDRLPDTSESQLALIRARLLAMYPVESVDLSLHEPVKTKIPVTGAGESWETLLDSMRDLRAAESPDPDVYYFGLISPAESLLAYCPDQCYLGLSFRTDKPAAKYQAGVGVGFTGETAASVLAHELGHMAGRKHAPCKVSSYIDPQYPQPQGQTGSWGWDLRNRALYAPETTDLMGYCSPAWISDYTYRAILDRLAEVNGTTKKSSLEQVESWRALLVSGGRARWGLESQESGAVEGTPEMATVRDEAGAVITTVEVRRLELGEGDRFTVLVPQPQPGWATIQVAGAAPVRFDQPGAVSPLER
jgi:hypothetical protein